MHIHILGICGTFMGSLAVLAKEEGIRVTGCDQSVYPPMSTQLEEQGIELITGYDVKQLELGADLYVIGNAISRGNTLLEEILNRGLPYTSGPGFLADTILPGKWVLGIAGTHGKTTTSSMLAWILEFAGMKPGFLIGGVPGNFGYSARLGETPFFVIEADEYDSAFFDKRSKFVHYRPRTFVINNLEFDHADIFADLAAIQTQFHHVIRTIPANGRVIYPAGVNAIDQVLENGCWAEQQSFIQIEAGNKIKAENDAPGEEILGWERLDEAGNKFAVMLGDESVNVTWSLTGDHNIANGVAAMLAARHVGVTLAHGAEALSCFKGVKRRMECIAKLGSVSVYDDFAHHPTAIKTTLEGLRRKVGDARVIALIEPRSNTMKMGVHARTLLSSAEQADKIIWADLSGKDDSGMSWLADQIMSLQGKHALGHSVDDLINKTLAAVVGETHIVIMSNGGFSGIHKTLIDAIESNTETL